MDSNSRSVFLVHGRDTRATASMKELLRAVDLLPIEWEEAVSWTGNGSPAILDVIKAALRNTKAVVVLLTPDEEVRLRPHLLGSNPSIQDKEVGYQSRPNVLIEAGMALASFDHTIIVEIGENRPVSDLQGLHVVRFDGGEGARKILTQRLRNAGYEPRTEYDHYLTAGFAYLSDPANEAESRAISATVGDLIIKIESTQKAIHSFAWRWEQNDPSYENRGRFEGQTEQERQVIWDSYTNSIIRYGSQRVNAYAQEIEPLITDVLIRAKRVLGDEYPALNDSNHLLEYSGTNYISMRMAANQLQALKTELELQYRV